MAKRKARFVTRISETDKQMKTMRDSKGKQT
jgi:hypothetical protein